MRKDWRTWGRTAALPLGLLLAACSGGKTVDLGGDEQGLAGEDGAVCEGSGIASGDFYVGTYDALRKLQGCREIRGSLVIGKLDVPDLTPLSELRVVDGTLHLGEFAYEASMGISPADLVFAPGEAEAVDVEATIAPGEVWFPSLAGLGELEGVHDLVLEGIGAADLAELRSLRRVGGTLKIGAAPLLRELSGFEAVSIGALWLSAVPELVSLEGVLPAVDRLDHLVLWQAPKLVDIAALAGVQEVIGELRISETGLTNLGELAVLDSVLGGITIEGNSELVDLTALDRLVTVSWIVLMNNPKLAVMPRFTGLENIESLQITYNDALEELNLAMPSLELIVDWDRNYPRRRPWRLLEVDHNSRLERLTISQKARVMESVAVHSNDSLEGLHLGGLESANGVIIDANPALSRVVAPRIRTVDTLIVTGNPLLSLAPFAKVRTFVTDLSGNADELAP